MALEVKIPTVGESITEVTIAKWLKKDGDTVQRDELIAELESDKATFELPAEGAGVLRLRAAEGDTIGIGAVIAEIDGAAASAPQPSPSKGGGEAKAASAPAAAATGSEKTPAAPQAAVAAPAAPAPALAAVSGGTYEMKVPTVGESITEVIVAKWLKKDGDTVQRDELIAELESDKATFELPAEAAGTLRLAVAEGTTVPIGGLLARIEGATTGGASTPAATAPAASASPQAAGNGQATGSYAAGVPSPAAGKILDEKGVPASTVSGTGRDGRITKEDALNAPPAPQSASAPALQPVVQPPAQPAVQPETRSERREKMTSLRRTVARRLVAVKNETAMLTTFNEVDMQPIMELRTKYKDKFKEKHGVGLGFMSFFTKAVCVALKEFPAVNAQLNGQEIIYHDYCDVSIAVSAPKGLVVPVIRNAETMSFEEIEKEVVRLATRARDSKLTIEEMQGGTFTITNGGVFGSMLSTPIINAPQSAILGMHNIVERPVAVGGQVVIRPIMYVALSYDHRIIDGRESVSFLVRVKQLLEDPTRLLLGV